MKSQRSLKTLGFGRKRFVQGKQQGEGKENKHKGLYWFTQLSYVQYLQKHFEGFPLTNPGYTQVFFLTKPLLAQNPVSLSTQAY